MYDWLLYLLTPLMTDAAPQKDYVGMVAAEAAYAALLPDKEPVKPLVDPKDCKTCNGLGRVRSGDGQGWEKCPDCQPAEEAAAFRVAPLAGSSEVVTAPKPPAAVSVPKSETIRYSAPSSR